MMNFKHQIEFFINEGPNLIAKHHPLIKVLRHYCTNAFTIFAEKSLTEEEFNVEIFSLKLIKILGSQNITVNVIIKNL